MKVLIVQTPACNPENGGVQRITYSLGEYFSLKGISVCYFSFEAIGNKTPQYGTLQFARHPKGIENSLNRDQFSHFINEMNPHIVINQMPYENGLVDLLVKQQTELNFKLLACLHNSLFAFKNNLKDILTRRIGRGLTGLAYHLLLDKLIIGWHVRKNAKVLKGIIDRHDKFITETEPNITELRFFLPNFPKDKVLCIPNPLGIKVGGFNINQKEKIILHVGRINVEQKRSDLLLNYWHKIYRKLPDWKFIVVGDGPFLSVLKDQVLVSEVDRMELVGYQDPKEFYKKASIFMMPSANEGLPNTIIEAQSSGCPVIAFRSYPAIDWIVNNGNDSVLIEPFDVYKMAEKTIELAKNQIQRDEMQRNALMNANRFSIDIVGAKWLSLFDQIRND